MALRMCIFATFIIVDLHISYVMCRGVWMFYLRTRHYMTHSNGPLLAAVIPDDKQQIYTTTTAIIS
jgi:hypothetical protein